MTRFECDYTEGAHPLILEALACTNAEQTPGYGTDEYCEAARSKIKAACAAPAADVHFLVGGTQTNLTVISAALRPYQGVVSAVSGHINGHETGAVEACGYKVLPLPSADGTITAEQVAALCEAHRNDASREHSVQPAMVYVSFPTENGTLYSKAALERLSAVCRENDLLLFADGARLGYGLASPVNDVTLADLARLCDVFYIGGTKVGALFGEAVVITNSALKKDFRYLIKQKGGMLAKGRLLGIQFDVLFTEKLYFSIAERAVSLALRVRRAFAEKGVPFLYDSYTNQQFPILTAAQIKALGKDYAFSIWKPLENGGTAVRFCTSWATTEDAVNRLIADIAKL